MLRPYLVRFALSSLAWLVYFVHTFAAEPPPLPQVTAGAWVLTWGDEDYALELGPLHHSTTTAGETTWLGSWNYSPASRYLIISETIDDRVYQLWWVRLDGDLKGTAEYGTEAVPVRLRKKEGQR